MNTVIIHAAVGDKQEEFLTALKALFTTMNCNVETSNAGDSTFVYAVASGETLPSIGDTAPIVPAAELSPEIAIELPPTTEAPQDADIPSFDVSLTPGTVTDIATAMQDTIPAEPEQTGGELIIKNLSTSKQLPFTFAAGNPCSELKAKDITPMDDYVSFNCCDMTYKFPVEKPEMQNTIVNVDPQFTTTSIRVTIELPNGSNTMLPVLLKLVQSSDDSGVVIGSDLNSIIIGAMKGTPNESVSVQ
jgi:hypothetical protein